MALTLNVGKCTLLGNYRENNEDAIEVKQFPDLTVCLVADGMGGQAAGELGLPVSTEMPKEVYKLMGLYPQTAQRRPSVEYIPVPRSRELERRPAAGPGRHGFVEFPQKPLFSISCKKPMSATSDG